tara:strand:+ start:71 stop:1510 length:1440 start_codon:yes stop_codon:yes gene_type:complete
MKNLLLIAVTILAVGCGKNQTTDNGKPPEIEIEDLPPIPEQVTKEFVMTLWNQPNDEANLIKEIKNLGKAGIWIAKRKRGPSKNELVTNEEAKITIKFANQRYMVRKVTMDNASAYSAITYDFEKEKYYWWEFGEDSGRDFFAQYSGQLLDGNLFEWESVDFPSLEDGKLKFREISRTDDKIEAVSELRKGGEIIGASEDTLTWSEELPTQTKPVEENVLDVKPEEPVAETKPVEELPLNPNLKYEIKDDEVTITGCDKKASGTIIIPATIEGKTVTSIGEEALVICTNLKSIIIPDSVTSIGKSAFMHCSNLTSITFGKNSKLTSIGSQAFGDCSNLKSIIIPDSVTSIGFMAFGGCSNLTSIIIPDSVTSIGRSAFVICTSLTNITIPNSVTSIEEGAFYNCSSLTSITIGSSVTSIGVMTFGGCSRLSTVTFLGDTPKVDKSTFEDTPSTIYRKPEAKGWGDTFAGRPVKLISEKP